METFEFISVKDFTQGGIMVQARLRTVTDLKTNEKKTYLKYL